MELYTTNPLTDNRWDELVTRHPHSSVFHQRSFLSALNRTYNYEPFVLTTSPPGTPLRNGAVFCRVSSWITGKRVVSLPFADHCDPLLDSGDDISEFSRWLRVESERQSWDYVEVRPLWCDMRLDRDLLYASSYCFHRLDMEPTLEKIFAGLHRNSIQRKIRRAEKEQLSYEVGSSEPLVNAFYSLLLKTKLRHRLIPQPRSWFSNLVACMGHCLQIRLARRNGEPIAALLTLRHKSTMVFKYGCSDERYHNLGTMPFLFWKLIEESKNSGVAEIDFGRSDPHNKGLITFKDRFSTTRKSLRYFRYTRVNTAGANAWNSDPMRRIISVLPAAVLPTAGRLLYRHIG